MSNIVGPDGQKVGAEKPFTQKDMEEAKMAHQIVMAYLKHNFLDQCELCRCAPCRDVRKVLAAPVNHKIN